MPEVTQPGSGKDSNLGPTASKIHVLNLSRRPLRVSQEIPPKRWAGGGWEPSFTHAGSRVPRGRWELAEVSAPGPHLCPGCSFELLTQVTKGPLLRTLLTTPPPRREERSSDKAPWVSLETSHINLSCSPHSALVYSDVGKRLWQLLSENQQQSHENAGVLSRPAWMAAAGPPFCQPLSPWLGT